MADYLHILMFAAAFIALLAGYQVALTLGGIALAFAALGVAFDVFEPRALIFWPSRILGNMSNQVLAAVPLFVIMGVILEKSRVAEDLLIATGRLLSGVRGGLGYAVVIVGALLAASTGIVGATVVTMTLIALPSMLRQGYDKRIAAGTIAASGTLGQIIPPSIVLIVLADTVSNANAEARQAMGQPPSPVSAGDLFTGALLPGMLLVGLYLAYLAFIAIKNPASMPARSQNIDIDQDQDIPSVARTAFSFIAPITLIIAVLGSILGGFTSPTEAAAVGAIGAIILAGIRIRLDDEKTSPFMVISIAGAFALILLILTVWGLKLGWLGNLPEDAPPSLFFSSSLLGKIYAALICGLIGAGTFASLFTLGSSQKLQTSFNSAAQITSMIFLILICAGLFSIVFRGLGGDEFIEHLLINIPGGMWGALAVTMLVMFLMGFFLDFLEITFIIVPLVAPPLIMLGADPVWLAILMAMNLQTSFLTPPFGFALFYLKGAAPPEIDTPDIWRGAIPFIGLQIIALLAVVFIPQLVTALI
ncbi:TRAP transporter large permease [Hirschia baltica]|uniref:TRAP C4-dicarboxylate transport system permease DctM subunit n=1 Tax=Hirschia baltica (strain ATCC 49814 / DSM 5838 / IFAM 1418) TaxID=582402 RepID=C6XIU7_HIRBI|nr:TRAP transporter large permease subunit [Hirschia baltica]ACT59042.1 TRAP C4-dicarboxylate transport system permease DctM subunit [Hirschia baltica ATCC 49814]